MAYQSQSQAYTAYKVQSALGTQASGAGAKVLSTTGGQGGRMAKAAVESATIRRDAMSLRGRHGLRKTNGAYSSELLMSQFDDIIEAVMRGSWGSANVQITQAAMTSITTGANTIVAAAGSWITQGVRVGMIVRLTNHSSAGNNNRNLRVTGVTASTITVAETLTVNAVADTTFELTIPGRRIINPSSLTKRYFTVEEHELDLDTSEVFTDCMWGSLRFSMAPNGNITVDTGWVGTGRFETLTGGSAPLFASPTELSSAPLAATGATLRMGSTDLLDLTAFDLSIDIAPNAPDVIAPPSTPYAPDVFPGSVTVSMNLTALRKDVLDVADFLAETQLSLHVMFAENETAPEDFLSIYVPNFTWGSIDKSALAKAGGPRTVTRSVPAALVGIDDRGGAYDPTMISFQVSNAS